MGYGGAAKTIVRIAVPIAVGMIPGAGPLAIALASAAATAATGGDFKEVLIAGGTSYVGAHIGAAAGESLTQAGDIAQAAALSNVGMDSFAAGAVAPASTFVEVLANIPGIEALGSTVGEQFGGEALREGPGVTDLPVTAGATAEGTPFVDASAFPDDPSALMQNAPVDVVGAPGSAAMLRTGSRAASLPTIQPAAGTQAADWINVTLPGQAAPDALGAMDVLGGLAKFGKETYNNVANKTIGELGGSVSGVMTAGHLNMTVQAALMEYPEYLVESGIYTPEEVAVLTEQMRQSRLADIQTELTGEIADPGVTGPQTWSDILGQGLGIIESEAFPGGGDVPESQFAGIFDVEGIGQQAARRGFQAGVEETFPTVTAGESPFMPLSEQAVANILDPQREEAQRLGAIQQARGNLSPYGGQQFSEYIQGQDVGAREAVGRAGEAAQSEAMSELRAPYETAMAGSRLYVPGGELPYDRQLLGEEREATIEERGTGIPGRAAEMAGTGLYDPIKAMSSAGAVQGVVSGAPQQQAMLDVLAARRRGDRGLRGIGSGGVF